MPVGEGGGREIEEERAGYKKLRHIRNQLNRLRCGTARLRAAPLSRVCMVWMHVISLWTGKGLGEGGRQVSGMGEIVLVP